MKETRFLASVPEMERAAPSPALAGSVAGCGVGILSRSVRVDLPEAPLGGLVVALLLAFAAGQAALSSAVTTVKRITIQERITADVLCWGGE